MRVTPTASRKRAEDVEDGARRAACAPARCSSSPGGTPRRLDPRVGEAKRSTLGAFDMGTFTYPSSSTSLEPHIDGRERFVLRRPSRLPRGTSRAASSDRVVLFAAPTSALTSSDRDVHPRRLAAASAEHQLCDHLATQPHVRAFINEGLTRYAAEYPHAEVTSTVRRGHHRTSPPQFRNGNTKTVDLRNKTDALRVRSTAQIRRKARRGAGPQRMVGDSRGHVRRARRATGRVGCGDRRPDDARRPLEPRPLGVGAARGELLAALVDPMVGSRRAFSTFASLRPRAGPRPRAMATARAALSRCTNREGTCRARPRRRGRARSPVHLQSPPRPLRVRLLATLRRGKARPRNLRLMLFAECGRSNAAVRGSGTPGTSSPRSVSGAGVDEDTLRRHHQGMREPLRAGRHIGADGSPPRLRLALHHSMMAAWTTPARARALRRWRMRPRPTRTRTRRRRMKPARPAMRRVSRPSTGKRRPTAPRVCSKTTGPRADSRRRA